MTLTTDTTTAKPALTDDELKELDDFLLAEEIESMNLEMLDGFLAALVCDPETDVNNINKLLTYVWDPAGAKIPDEVFKDDQTKNRIFALITKHAAHIDSCISGPTPQESYLPMFYASDDEDSDTTGYAWVHGFFIGLDIKLDTWLPNDDKLPERIAVALGLLHKLAQGDVSDPESEEYIREPERSELLTYLPDAVITLYNHKRPKILIA